MRYTLGIELDTRVDYYLCFGLLQSQKGTLTFGVGALIIAY